MQGRPQTCMNRNNVAPPNAEPTGSTNHPGFFPQVCCSHRAPSLFRRPIFATACCCVDLTLVINLIPPHQTVSKSRAATCGKTNWFSILNVASLLRSSLVGLCGVKHVCFSLAPYKSPKLLILSIFLQPQVKQSQVRLRFGT